MFWSSVTLLGTAVLTFLLVNAVPGDVARVIAGSKASPKVLDAPYLRAVNANWLSERSRPFPHALPNALIPVVTIRGVGILYRWIAPRCKPAHEMKSETRKPRFQDGTRRSARPSASDSAFWISCFEF